MKPEILRALKKFYGKKGNIVWILDENWEIIWKNCTYDGKKSFPELLEVSENFWGDIQEKEICWKGDFFSCDVDCYKKDKYRVIVLKEKEVEILGHSILDKGAMVHGVHSMKILIELVKNYLESNNLHEMDDVLKAFDGNFYLIYRNLYIDRILSNLKNQDENKTLFEIGYEILEIYEEAKEILDDYAETEFIFEEKKEIFLIEDRNLFCATMLSGIVLCCKEPDQRQDLKITLNYIGEKAVISIYMTALDEIRKDRQLQGSVQRYNDYSGEESLLNTFCSRHNGSWNMIQKKEKGKISVCCKIMFSTDTPEEITFHSPEFTVPEESFFDVYHVMLARICVQHV